MDTNLHSIIDWSAGAILIVFSIGLYYLGKKIQSVRLFSYLSLFLSMWSFIIGIANLSVMTEDIYMTNLVIKLSYFLAFIMVNIFLLFVISYPYENKIQDNIVYPLILSLILIFYLLFFTNLIIGNVITIQSNNYPSWEYGPLWFIFDINFITIFLIGINIIYKKLRETIDKQIIINLNFMIIVFIIGFIPPLITSLVLPRLGIFNYDWTSPLSSIIWISIISYAITKHRLFNIKIIAIETAIFILWIFLLFRTILSENSNELYISIAVFIISIFIGITLIKNVINGLKFILYWASCKT